MGSNPSTQRPVEQPKPGLSELVHALRVATDTWFERLEGVARGLERLHQDLVATRPQAPFAEPVTTPTKPRTRRATPAPRPSPTPAPSAPPPSRSVAVAPPQAPPRPKMGGLDGPIPGTKPLPDPLTKAPHALTDAQRDLSWPEALRIADNLVTMLGAGHPQLRDGLKGQLALEHIPFDEQLLSEALLQAGTT